MKPYLNVLFAIAVALLITSCAPPPTPDQLLALTPEQIYSHSANYECVYSKALTNKEITPFGTVKEGFLDREKNVAWFSTLFSIISIEQVDENNSKVVVYRHPTGVKFGHQNYLIEYLENNPCENIPKIQDFKNANSDVAKVFFYRVGDGKAHNYSEINIFDGEKKITELRTYEYTWLEMSPGNHLLTAKWDLMSKPLFEEGHMDKKELKINFEGGKTYFINYKAVQDFRPTTQDEKQGLIGKALSKSHFQSVGLVEEPENVGVIKINASNFKKSI